MRPLFSLVLMAWLAGACSSSGGDYCASCLEEKCPDLLSNCRQDDKCSCVADCLGENAIPGVQGCLDTCGMDERTLDFALLEECVASACPDAEDECAVPDDYVFPDTTQCDGPDIPISGGSLPDCGFDTGLVFDPQGEMLQLESQDQNVCVLIERRNDGAGSLANTKWTLLSLTIGPLNQVTLINDPLGLCWFSSHHNFLDWAHAWFDGRHYDIKIEGFSPAGRNYKLFVYEQGPINPQDCAPTSDGESCIGKPIELFPFNP